MNGPPGPKRTRSWTPYVLKGECGAATAEMVVVVPLLIVLLFAIVEFALWSQATQIAQAAAAQGVAAARVQDGTAAAGNTTAQRVVDELGRGPLTEVRIDAQRTTQSASVQVSGVVLSVIPMLRLPVHAEATGPVERFLADGNGFTNSETPGAGNPSGGG